MRAQGNEQDDRLLRPLSKYVDSTPNHFIHSWRYGHTSGAM